jgi:hypothetical protein
VLCADELQAHAYLAECSSRALAHRALASRPATARAAAFCSVAEAFETEPWWLVSSAQALWLMHAFRAALAATRAPAVAVLDFPFYRADYFRRVWGADHEALVVGAAGNLVRVRNSQRLPGSRLQGEDAGLLSPRCAIEPPRRGGVMDAARAYCTSERECKLSASVCLRRLLLVCAVCLPACTASSTSLQGTATHVA